MNTSTRKRIDAWKAKNNHIIASEPPVGGDRLTDPQRNVMDFFRRFYVYHGIPPTIREIGDRFEIKSPNGVVCHLTALVRKGFLKKAGEGQKGKRGLSHAYVPVVPEGHCFCCSQPLPNPPEEP